MIEQPQLADKLQEIKNASDQLTRLVSSAAEQGRAVDTVEQDLWHGLMQLGGKLLGALFAQLGDGNVGATIEREAQRPLKRSPRPQKRRYRSVFGVFELARYTYAEQPKRRAERIPFDEQVALPTHDYSLLLEKWVGASASEDSFEQAVAFLEQILNSRIPVDSAERICRRQSELAESYFEQLPTPPAESEGDILVETVDRKGVPIRRPHGQAPAAFGPSDQKGPKAGSKKMAAVGSVYSVDRHVRDADAIVRALFRRRNTSEQQSQAQKRPAPQHRRMRAFLPTVASEDDGCTIDPAAAVCGWMSEEVAARQPNTEEVVVLCDGEESLWQSVSLFHGASIQVTEILDLMHAVPRIWSCGEQLHGDEPLEGFVLLRLRRLLQGEASSVIRGFRRMATQRGLGGSARKAVDDACDYLERHLSRLRYGQYLSRGLPIATGIIEGACRYLVKDRLERTGMRWTVAGAQAILELRSIKTSGLAEEYHAYYRSKRIQERYGERRTNYAAQFNLAAC